MSTLLLFLIPPVAGAFIGYVTNAIALKMLFRPLKEIRIFGIRLPFTPGILPKQRHRLAQSIGEMVERELITPHIIRSRLASEEVREKALSFISLFTEKIIEKTPGELMQNNLPPEQQKLIQEKISLAADNLYPVLSASFFEFLRRREIRIELESKGRIILRNIFMQLNSLQRLFLSAGQYDITLQEKMPEIIDDLILNAENFLHNGSVKEKMLAAVTSSFGKIAGGQEKIGVLFDISENQKKELDNFLFNKMLSAVDGQIESILASINIKNLVQERIDSLDMIRVERIILDVMADQFKWINIFGGILGFLIGLFQVSFTWLVFLR